jgi:glycosyltransferase involved in cell wall biosynthesis
MADATPVRLHLTNIAGIGAVQLLKSLLPALERAPGYQIEMMYLSGTGELANHVPAQETTASSNYQRRGTNAVSRFLECTLFAGKFDGPTPLLVLGDIPLRCKSRQTVFVHTILFTDDALAGKRLRDIKYHISRWLFGYNAGRVSAFIVQTVAMKASLVATYPEIADRIHVVRSPVPAWLLEKPIKRTARRQQRDRLRLFYPAATYPHKNHQLLKEIDPRDASGWPVAELALTIPAAKNPNPSVPWIECVGQLASDAVIAYYSSFDALLFLSRAESLGLPLVEAMWIGLPIVCPDLPYARTLCGDVAIYFDPGSIDSLRTAVSELQARLDAGWWPDWSEKIAATPRSWDEVASAMLKLATKGGDGRLGENGERSFA